MLSFILGKILRSEIARSYSNYIFNFKRNCQTVKLCSKVPFTSRRGTRHQPAKEVFQARTGFKRKAGEAQTLEYCRPEASLGARDGKSRARARAWKELPHKSQWVYESVCVRTPICMLCASRELEGGWKFLLLPHEEKHALKKQKETPLARLRWECQTPECGPWEHAWCSHRAGWLSAWGDAIPVFHKKGCLAPREHTVSDGQLHLPCLPGQCFS